MIRVAAVAGWTLAIALLARKVDAYLEGFDFGFSEGHKAGERRGRRRGLAEAQDALLVAR